MHEFSRHIFCWIAFFAFITFDYRYKFKSRLSYNIQQIFRTTYVLTFRVQISNAFGSRGNTLSLSINFACSRYHHLPSPFPGKQLKAITTAQIWKINWTVPCIFTAAYICHKLESTCIFCHITCVTIYQMRKHTTPTRPQLTNSDKLWLLATLRLHGWQDRDGFQVHCGTVLGRGDAFSTWRQIRPPKQSHNALESHLDPVNHATSKWRIAILSFCEKAWQKCWPIRARHLQKREIKTKYCVASRLATGLQSKHADYCNGDQERA